MSKEVIELTSENFDKNISKGSWIVDFWAEWCGPCRIMAPHFEAAAKEMKGKINFGKVNVERESELAERFQIMSIPTIILFKNKEQVARQSGAMPKDSIIDIIKENF